MWGGVSGTWGVVGGLTWGARFINAKGVARRAEASASSRRNPPPHRPTRARSAGATIPTAAQEPPCPLYSEQQRVLLLLLLHLRPFSLNRRNNLLALSALAILLQQIAINLEWQKGRIMRGNGAKWVRSHIGRAGRRPPLAPLRLRRRGRLSLGRRLRARRRRLRREARLLRGGAGVAGGLVARARARAPAGPRRASARRPCSAHTLRCAARQRCTPCTQGPPGGRRFPRNRPGSAVALQDGLIVEVLVRAELR